MNLKTPAAEYTIGMAIWMVLYVAILCAVIIYIKQHQPTGPLLYALSVLPALPIGGTILTFLRFIERSDEYCRAVLTRRFIVATGLTLFISTTIGFVENFSETQLFDHYLVYVLFWMCWGVCCAFIRHSK